MIHRILTCMFFLFAASLTTHSQAMNYRNAGVKNIVFFFIDDLGWTDVGFMYGQLGCKDRFYETPNIDRLARDGMIFTSAYANGPNCAPSRACLMSGQYGPRHGIYTVGDPRRGNHPHRRLEPIENKTVLDDKFITIAEALGAGGYVSASMGKWHLGADPRRQGFDVNIAGREWGSPSGGGYHSPLKYPNLVVPEKGVYLTDALTEEAVEFIEENRNNRFFLYLTHYAVHTPIQGKQELVEKYKAKEATEHHKNAAYAAMIESVDESVGTVLRALDELGLAKETVVLFFSDNGGHSGATSNHPLRGAKGMLYEGGIREPMIVKWPGVTPPGSVCHEPVIGVDFYPTLLEISGTDRPANYSLDGVSLVPLLKDPRAKLGRTAIFWHFPCFLQGRGDPHGGPFRTTPAGAVRMGDWKLIEWFETGRIELYNLAEDISESKNLAQQFPDKMKELHDAMQSWRREVGAPIPTTPNPKYDPSATAPAGGNRKAKGRTKRG
jgi:arylsulfatase A-like enzyme